MVTKSKGNELEWSQFCRLGEMIGDGLHYEADGKWITKEYKKLSRLLIPEIKEQEKIARKMKAEKLDAQMAEVLKRNKCSCGGELIQNRSGSKVCHCIICNNRYTAKYKTKDE